MSWYTVIDFAKSRVGRVLIFSAAFLVILLLLAKRYRDDLREKEGISESSPEAAAGHGGIHSTPLLDPIRKAADRPKTRRSLRMNHSLKIK